MSFPRSAAGAGGLLYAIAVTFIPLAAVAAAQDYRFEAVGPPIKSGKATVVKIRLVHVPDRKPVPEAVIFQTRFDMGPDGMAERRRRRSSFGRPTPICTRCNWSRRWAATGR